MWRQPPAAPARRGGYSITAPNRRTPTSDPELAKVSYRAVDDRQTIKAELGTPEPYGLASGGAMVAELLRVPIHEGSDEYIEVEVDPGILSESVRLASDMGPDAATAPFSLASSVYRILPALSAILTPLRRAEHAPDEIGMELGLKIGGETGLIFAKGTTEATFVVTLSWHKPTGQAASELPNGH